MADLFKTILEQVNLFEVEAHKILAGHEASTSRVITLEDTYRELKTLSLRQDELFQEAIHCLENGFFRAAYVMSWAAFMDYLEAKMVEKYLTQINTTRPKWCVSGIDSLREQVPEHQLILVCKEIGFFNKNEEKAFLGLLNKRNECAHPSNYCPNLNETMGYISELLTRIKTLQTKP